MYFTLLLLSFLLLFIVIRINSTASGPGISTLKKILEHVAWHPHCAKTNVSDSSRPFGP